MTRACCGVLISLAVALSFSQANAMALAPAESDRNTDAPSSMSQGLVESLRRPFPVRQRIAIVLRGETFRYGYRDSQGQTHRKPCADESIDAQLAAIHSVIEKIIEPLEQRGNNVEVLLTTNLARKTRIPAMGKLGVHSTSQYLGCRFDRMLNDALVNNSRRVVNWRSLVTDGQADSMLKVIDALNDQYKGVPRMFRYILILRNDMLWHKSIEEFAVDLEKVNVLSRCQPGAREGCVHDTVWMMPGYLYPAFTSAIGHDACFDPAHDPDGDGHRCAKAILDAVAEAGHTNAFGWIEPGQRRVRAGSDVADLLPSL